MDGIQESMPFIYFLTKLFCSVFFIFFFVRIMGNKELRQSTPIEFAYLVLLVSIAWDLTLESKYNLLHILITMGLFTFLIIFIDWITYKVPKIERLLIGEAQLIIKDGKLDSDLIDKQRLSQDEIESMLRLEGVFDIAEVERSYLEIGGGISVKKKDEKKLVVEKKKKIITEIELHLRNYKQYKIALSNLQRVATSYSSHTMQGNSEIYKIMLHCIDEALSGLTEEERSFITHYYFNGETIEEIARHCHLSQQTLHTLQDNLMEHKLIHSLGSLIYLSNARQF